MLAQLLLPVLGVPWGTRQVWPLASGTSQETEGRCVMLGRDRFGECHVRTRGMAGKAARRASFHGGARVSVS